MKFGLFYQLPCADSQSEPVRYQETLEQIRVADELGFDCAWLAELHFFKSFSIMPSPLIVAAVAAQQTKKIRLGIAVNLLPLYPPLRCAEDGATVDILSNGRLDFGVGRGALPLHFAGFNVSREESRERFEEALQIIRKAWTEERFSFNGQYYQVHDVVVVPKPVQKPHPPVRIAANSPETAVFAGREGYSVFLASVTNPLPRMREQVARYRQAQAEHGQAATALDVASLFFVSVGDSVEGVRSAVEGSITNYYHTANRMIRAGTPLQPGESYGYLREAQRQADVLSFADIERNIAIFGEPQQCIDKIHTLHREVGMGQLICWFNPGGLVPHRRVLSMMERFACAVMPTVREL